jgi:predicted transcriptional regulator YdeE
MQQHQVAVVNRPAIRTAGFKVRTDMAKASRDCPGLWEERFGPVMETFPADPARPDESYGVSVMVDDSAFDYWAVMPIADGADIPEGMDVLTLPEGIYAECALASLSELGDALNYIYGPWIAGQEKLTLNMQGACYERYTSDFSNSGRLVIYCPLLEK